MKIIETIIKALCLLCAASAAFCFGYALITRTTHVFIMAALYLGLALLISGGIRSDRKREEERRKNNWRD